MPATAGLERGKDWKGKLMTHRRFLVCPITWTMMGEVDVFD
jgi:hypothetical protein